MRFVLLVHSIFFRTKKPESQMSLLYFDSLKKKKSEIPASNSWPFPYIFTVVISPSDSSFFFYHSRETRAVFRNQIDEIVHHIFHVSGL